MRNTRDGAPESPWALVGVHGVDGSLLSHLPLVYATEQVHAVQTGHRVHRLVTRAWPAPMTRVVPAPSRSMTRVPRGLRDPPRRRMRCRTENSYAAG